MALYGLTYHGVKSSSLDVYAKSIDRSILPAVRREVFVIPGRSGDRPTADKQYETRPIVVRLTILFKRLEDLRLKTRKLAEWLSEDGQLIFDDEPDKAYTARVESYTGLQEDGGTGECDVTFICQPYAESLNYNEVIDAFTDEPHETALTTPGSAKADCLIIIRNTGGININTIRITRKAGV